MDFNNEFRNCYKNLSKDNSRCSDLDEVKFSIFASFSPKVSYDDDEEEDDLNEQNVFNIDNSIKLDDFRRLLFLHFLAKLLNKRIDVYVTNNVHNFKEITSIFNFDEKYFQIKCLNDGDDDTKKILKESKYAIIKQDSTNLINLKQIIDEYHLSNFDSNISCCNIDFEENVINSVRNCKDFLLNQNRETPNLLIQVCSNSQFVAQQKSFLLLKVLLKDELINENKFLLIAQVKSDVASINEYLKFKEKYFQETTAQRMSIPFEMCENNVKLLTICSITFDLLKVNHNSDIKLQTNNSTNEHDSAFLLYNCARISAILTKFKYLVNQGTYPQLPEIESIDFDAVLKNDLEKRLCKEFLFTYENNLSELKANLIESFSIKKLQIKLNVHKICRFLFEFSKLFSSYYSKVKVLEDPKFKHLYPIMFARIYLMEAIYNAFQYLLSIFNIKTPERI